MGHGEGLEAGRPGDDDRQPPRVVAWVDGGSRGNPGAAGCGVVIEGSDGRREEHTLYLGRATNNVAEYAALLAALERAAAVGAREVEVRADSQLVVNQMTGAYRVKARHLQQLWLHASRLARGFSRFTIRHVPRGRNAAADRLANRAIDTRESTLPTPEGL